MDQFATPSSEESVVPGRPIRVMIVEDHPLMTQGLRRVVEMEDALEIVGEVDNGAEAVWAAKRLNPDVILMDINLPEKNGLQATSEIKSDLNGENISIIVLTSYDDEEQFFHALRAGASAYFPKDVRPSELVSAIHAVSKNQYMIFNEVMSKSQAFRWLIHQLETFSVFGDSTEDLFTPLGVREMEILTLITRGVSNKEIARSLDISRQTVKNHMSSVLRKLSVEDRTQAAVLALRRGWIRLEDTSK
jgi:DNA-binding NarL/FixJ family response regulator